MSMLIDALPNFNLLMILYPFVCPKSRDGANDVLSA